VDNRAITRFTSRSTFEVATHSSLGVRRGFINSGAGKSAVIGKALTGAVVE
jgi:hypothetical protein